MKKLNNPADKIRQTLFAKKVIIDKPWKTKIKWHKRLFSWPWRPWVKYQYAPAMEDGKIIDGGHYLMMSEKTWNDVVEKVNNQNRYREND